MQRFVTFACFLAVFLLFISPIVSESDVFGISSLQGTLFKVNTTAFEVQPIGLFSDGGDFVVDNANGIIYVLNYSFTENVIVGYRVSDAKLSFLKLPPRHNDSVYEIVFDPKAKEVILFTSPPPGQEEYWSLTRVSPVTGTYKTSPDFKAPYSRPFKGITYDYTKDIFYAFTIGGYLAGYNGVTGKEIVHIPTQPTVHYQALEFDPKTGLIIGIYTGELGQPHIASWNPETGAIKELLSLSFRFVGMQCSASLDQKTRLYYVDCGYLALDFSDLFFRLFVVDIDAVKVVHETSECKGLKQYSCPDQIAVYYH